jgi:hypothetical protein
MVEVVLAVECRFPVLQTPMKVCSQQTEAKGSL